MNSKQIERFMESVKVGYTIYVSPAMAGETNCVVRDMGDGCVSLIPVGESWDSEPFEVDLASIASYRILVRDERKIPFSAELEKIVGEVEAAQEIEMINFGLLQEMVPEEENIDYQRRVQAIWSSTNTAHDKNKFDDIIRKCNLAIQDFGEERVFLALRGYNAYRYSLLDIHAPKWEQVKSDFRKAQYARGLYWISSEEPGADKAAMLLNILRSEKKIDRAVLYTFVQNATVSQAGAYLHSVIDSGKDDASEAVKYACVYVANRAKGESFRLPDEAELFSPRNMEYIMAALPADAEPEQVENDTEVESETISPIEDEVEEEPLQSQEEPDDIQDEVFTGSIIRVFKGKHGFIRLDQKCNFLESGDLFFHLSNVIDDELCCKLEKEVASIGEKADSVGIPIGQYRVEFYPSKNIYKDGGICAGDIQSESQPEDNKKEPAPVALEYKRGYITSFTKYGYNNKEVKKGWIDTYDTNKRYGFKIADIADPYVREYLVTYWDSFAGQEGILVSFVAEESDAKQICRVEEKLPRNLDQDIERNLSPEELSMWKVPRQQEGAVEQNQKAEEDPHISRTVYYRQLPRWEGALPKTTRPGTGVKPQPQPNPQPQPSTQEQYHEYFRKMLHKQPYSKNGLALLQTLKEKQGADAMTDQYRDDCIRMMNDEDSQMVVTPVVGYLFDYYIKLNNTDAAIGLLDAVSEELDSANIVNRRVWFSRDKYLNRRVTALEKTRANGEIKYLDELYRLYMQKQSASALVNQKYHFQYKRASIRYSQGRYNEAISDFSNCLSLIDDFNSLGAAQRNLYECRFHILMADCYLAIGALEKSKESAAKVLLPMYRDVLGIDKLREQARSIMQGNRLQNTEETVGISEIAVIKPKNKQNGETPNYDSDEYPPYVNYLLNHFALASVFKGMKLIRIAENKTFVNNAFARSELLNFLKIGLDSVANNANIQNAELAMAKFIVSYSTDQSSKNSQENKKKAFNTLGNSLRWYADEYIRMEKKDSAIYLYTLAAQYVQGKEYKDCLYRATGSVFREGCEGHSDGFYAALRDERMRYISYFCGQIKENLAQSRGDDEHIRQEMYTMSLNRFISLFEVARFDSMTGNTEMQEARTSYIMNVSSTIRRRMMVDKIREFNDAFLRICKRNLEEYGSIVIDTTDEAFMQLYEDSVRNWDALRRDFERMLLTPTGAARFACEDMKTLRDLIAGVQGHEYFLTHLEGKTMDAQRIQEMLTIASSWYTYHDQKAFSERITALNQIVDRCEGMKKQVLDSPTSVSFELVLPNVEAILSSVHKEMDELYKVEPMLKLDVVDDNAGVGGSEQIRFDLILSNVEAERQNVTVSSMKVVNSDPGVTILGNVAFQPITLGGGKRVSYELSAKVSESVYQQGFFKAKVTITYSYQVSHDAQNQSTKTKEMDAVVNLKHVQFTEIRNPYMAGSLNEETEIIRTGIFDKLQRNITKGSHSGTVLWGQKRSGKTVILNGVKKKCQEWNTEKIKYIYAKVNMIPGGSTDPYRAVLKNILSGLSRSIRGKNDYLKYDELDAVAKYLGDASKAMLEAKDPRELFLEKLTILGDQLEDITKGKEYCYHIIIAVDEFTNCLDMLDRGELEREDLVFWKKLVESSNVPLHLILVAHDNWRELLGKNTNALAVFDNIQVSYMTDSEADELLTKHMKVEVNGSEESRFRNDCHKRIRKLTAGSPYLIQEVCRILIEFMNAEKMVYIVQEQLERFIANYITGEGGNSSIGSEYLDPQLNPVVNGGDTTARKNTELLQAFAKASNNPEEDWISLRSARLTMPDEEVNRLLDELDQSHRAIIERKREGDSDQLIRFKVPLLGAWLKYKR